MKVVFAINRIEEVGFRQTTALLIAACVRRGFDVFFGAVNGFSAETAGSFSADSPSESGQSNRTIKVSVSCAKVPKNAQCNCNDVETLATSSPILKIESIEEGDLIFIRTNPGRDVGRTVIHDSFLDICRAAKASGIRVVNDPAHLKYFASKASLAGIDPEFCPPMVVSNRTDLIADFVRRSKTSCVIKPLVGSRGQNVIQVRHDDEELEELINSTFNSAGVVAQHFVDADHAGDKRVVVLNGKPLEINGHLAGIERRPAQDDFRANLHAGGTAHQLTLSPPAMKTAEHAARLLFENGVSLAGVDLIGDKIIEFNVFSTGGLFDAESFSGESFSDEIVQQIVP